MADAADNAALQAAMVEFAKAAASAQRANSEEAASPAALLTSDGAYWRAATLIGAGLDASSSTAGGAPGALSAPQAVALFTLAEVYGERSVALSRVLAADPASEAASSRVASSLGERAALLPGAALDDVQACPPATTPLLLPFWLLGAIARSVRRGAHLTPTLYAPPDIWRQPTARIVGYALKTAAFRTLLDASRRFATVLVPVSVAGPAAFQRELGLFLHALAGIEETLKPLVTPPLSAALADAATARQRSAVAGGGGQAVAPGAGGLSGAGEGDGNGGAAEAYDDVTGVDDAAAAASAAASADSDDEGEGGGVGEGEGDAVGEEPAASDVGAAGEDAAPAATTLAEAISSMPAPPQPSALPAPVQPPAVVAPPPGAAGRPPVAPGRQQPAAAPAPSTAAGKPSLLGGLASRWGGGARGAQAAVSNSGSFETSSAAASDAGASASSASADDAASEAASGSSTAAAGGSSGGASFLSRAIRGISKQVSRTAASAAHALNIAPTAAVPVNPADLEAYAELLAEVGDAAQAVAGWLRAATRGAALAGAGLNFADPALPAQAAALLPPGVADDPAALAAVSARRLDVCGFAWAHASGVRPGMCRVAAFYWHVVARLALADAEALLVRYVHKTSDHLRRAEA
jgi:hypothetical protein